jgi:hypothetical protein
LILLILILFGFGQSKSLSKMTKHKRKRTEFPSLKELPEYHQLAASDQLRIDDHYDAGSPETKILFWDLIRSKDITKEKEKIMAANKSVLRLICILLQKRVNTNYLYEMRTAILGNNFQEYERHELQKHLHTIEFFKELPINKQQRLIHHLMKETEITRELFFKNAQSFSEESLSPLTKVILRLLCFLRCIPFTPQSHKKDMIHNLLEHQQTFYGDPKTTQQDDDPPPPPPRFIPFEDLVAHVKNKLKKIEDELQLAIDIANNNQDRKYRDVAQVLLDHVTTSRVQIRMSSNFAILQTGGVGSGYTTI